MKKSKSKKTFSIVLPFYNEEDIMEDVIRSLVLGSRKNKLDLIFIMVNNGSTDRTGKIISDLRREYKELRPITIERNKGYGFGIRKGLEICDTDYLGFMWGDGQIKPNDLVRVIKQLQDNPKLDMCKIARVKRYDGQIRHLISNIYNILISSLFSLKIKDINGTPKIFKRKYYQKLSLSSDDWFLDTELMLKAKNLNMSIQEIPVIFYGRKKGSSNVSYLTILEFLKNLFIYRLKAIRI